MKKHARRARPSEKLFAGERTQAVGKQTGRAARVGRIARTQASNSCVTMTSCGRRASITNAPRAAAASHVHEGGQAIVWNVEAPECV